MEWNYLSSPKLQRCNRLGMDKFSHPTFYLAWDYLPMLGLKLIYVSKMAPSKNELLINTEVGLVFRFPIITHDWACILSYSTTQLTEIYILYSIECALIFTSCKIFISNPHLWNEAFVDKFLCLALNRNFAKNKCLKTRIPVVMLMDPITQLMIYFSFKLALKSATSRYTFVALHVHWPRFLHEPINFSWKR